MLLLPNRICYILHLSVSVSAIASLFNPLSPKNMMVVRKLAFLSSVFLVLEAFQSTVKKFRPKPLLYWNWERKVKIFC